MYKIFLELTFLDVICIVFAYNGRIISVESKPSALSLLSIGL